VVRWGRTTDGPASDAGGWFVTGSPDAGTEAAVDAISRSAPGDARALIAVDPAFNLGLFLAWSTTVYDRAIAAWRTTNPEALRPVMAPAVWDPYAEHVLAVGRVAFVGSLMAAATATPALDGATAEGGQQSVLVGFDVAADPSATAALGLAAEHRAWKERWLFQRPEGCRTHASGAVGVCPVCGAPAEPEETGRCKYCHSDITTRTSGWLVTRTETTMATFAKMDQRVAQIRADVTSRIPLPTAPVVGPPVQPPRAGPG
jgi:hypothetical protein